MYMVTVIRFFLLVLWHFNTKQNHYVGLSIKIYTGSVVYTGSSVTIRSPNV